MAAKKEKTGSTKKPIRKGGKPKAEKNGAADGAKLEAQKVADAAKGAIGHNSRIPSAKEMQGFFGRLDALHTAKAEASAKFMSDIKGVYEEMANKFGTSRKLGRRLYAKKKAEEAFADEIAELEQKEKDDLDRLMLGASKAFGEDTGFGAWLKATVTRDEKDFDEVAHAPAPVVKSAAEAALEAIEADQRAVNQEQTTH